MDKYTGFYINRPVGNNIFSYDERSNKSIFVPRLINGDLNDVVLGDEVCFNEVENGEEILCKGLKNFVEYNFNGKKVYIFDNHNHAFYFWINSFLSGGFEKGCKLVHVDQHKDTRAPENYNVNIEDIDDVFRYTNEVLNVGNFIKPALEYNLFSEVIIVDSMYSFNLEITGEYVLDIDLDIFSKDMDYINRDFKMSKIKEYIEKSTVITVATSPFFIDQNYAIKVLKELFNYDIM